MANCAWVGLDVGAENSQVCVTDDSGAVLGESLLPTRAGDVIDFVTSVASDLQAVFAFESGTFAIPLARSLRRRGCKVTMFDAFQTSRFLAIRQHKTDRNDARGLADVLRLGSESLRHVHIKTPEKQQIRSRLIIRRNLVHQCVSLENLLRSVLRLHVENYKPWKSTSGIRKNVQSELESLRENGIDLAREITPLLNLCESMREYLKISTDSLHELAKSIELCRRWMEIPGIGPLTALSFYTAIDDPARF